MTSGERALYASSRAGGLRDFRERATKFAPLLNALAITSAGLDSEQGSVVPLDALAAKLPLSGMIGCIKEAIPVSGLPQTFGLPENRGNAAQRDADIVTRLRRDGALIVGKSNIATALADWQTENPIYGRTNNPYNLTRTAGGSGGGGAAAVAAGLVDFDIGTDLIGSIRIPAAFCGVYGLRPTRNIAEPSLWSLVAPDPRAPAPVAVSGVITLGLGDMERIWEALCGNSPNESSPPIAACRLSFLEPDPEISFGPSVLAAPGVVKKRCIQAFSYVDVLPPDTIGNVSRIGRAGIQLAINRIATDFPGYFQNRKHHRPGSAVPAMPDISTVAENLRSTMKQRFTETDALVMPMVPLPPFRHEPKSTLLDCLQNEGGEATVTDGRTSVPYWQIGAYSAFACLTDYPSLAVPIGIADDGLPLSVQIMGRPGCERFLIHIAQKLTEGMPPLPPPLFSAR